MTGKVATTVSNSDGSITSNSGSSHRNGKVGTAMVAAARIEEGKGNYFDFIGKGSGKLHSDSQMFEPCLFNTYNNSYAIRNNSARKDNIVSKLEKRGEVNLVQNKCEEKE